MVGNGDKAKSILYVVTLYNSNPLEALTPSVLLESCIEIERGLSSTWMRLRIA